MTQTLHYLPAELLDRVEPARMGHRYTCVQRVELSDTASTLASDPGEEVLLVCIAGEAAYRHGDQTGTAVVRDMLYLPAGDQLELSGAGAVVMRFGAPCDRSTSFAHLSFAEADADERHKRYGDPGKGSRRDVWELLDERFDSQRFLAGLATGDPGGWTAWPPHEHAAQREETYVYFGLNGSFGIQCVYEEMDRPLAVALVREGHVVAVPKGYHPSCGSPAGPISYAYVMVSVAPDDRNFMDLTIQPEYGTSFE